MIGRGRSSGLLGFVVAAVVAVPSAAFVMERTVLRDQPDHEMELTASSGALSIANSREGQAIFTAVPMTPGSSTTGTVELHNSGDSDETLSLDGGSPSDSPGPGGGRLSARLRLRVVDVSNAAAPTTVYEGSLTGVRLLALGTLPKDARRTYEFVVTFPDGGANGADNAYQGSSASIGFEWTIGAAATTTTPTTPAPQPAPQPQAQPEAPAAAAPSTGEMSVDSTPAQTTDPTCPGAVTAQGGSSSMWAILNARSKARSMARARALARAKARARAKTRGKSRAKSRGKARLESRAAAKTKRAACTRTSSGG